MEMNVPFWYKLIDHWVNHLEFSRLTVPFLVGADLLLVHRYDPEKDMIAQLFDDITAYKALPYCPTISYCGTIGAYRIGLESRNGILPPCFFNEGQQASLKYHSDEFTSDYFQLLATMHAIYDEPINKGHFSKNRAAFGDWEPFSAADMQMIQQVCIS